MKQLFSPKQVAASIGVSESSLKRWCDQGVIPTEKTPGGHRKIRLGDVVQFIRSNEPDRELARPELLGLPVGLRAGAKNHDKAIRFLTQSLAEGDFEKARRVVFELFMGGVLLVDLCENVLSTSMHQLGDAWHRGELEIFQERRACEMVGRVLYELKSLGKPAVEGAPTAMGGGPSGDHYRLATQMVELVLSDAGILATSLGTALPVETLAQAAKHSTPDYFWLSVSHSSDLPATRAEITFLADHLPPATKLIVGGQALTRGDVIVCERVVFCESMKQMLDLLPVKN